MKANTFRRTAAGVLTALMLAVLLCAAVFAAGSIDTAKSGSISVYFGHEGEDFAGAEFELFRVADVSSGGVYTLTGDFAGYAVEVNGLTSSGWRALAQTLEAYVEDDGLVPAASAVTGSDGRAGFRGLKTGLYLVLCGGPYTHGGAEYTVEPALVSVPNEGADGEWVYNVSVTVKYESDFEIVGYEKISVRKVWRGDSAASRPSSVQVTLLRDGAAVDTVTLSEKNNWSYTWSRLERADYSIVERRVPNGYTVSVEREGDTFTVTNTRKRPGPTPTPRPSATPDRPPYPSRTPTPAPSRTPGPSPTSTPGRPPDKLPQTGMLWWPAAVLAGGGAVLIAAGAIIRRRKDDDEK